RTLTSSILTRDIIAYAPRSIHNGPVFDRRYFHAVSNQSHVRRFRAMRMTSQRVAPVWGMAASVVTSIACNIRFFCLPGSREGHSHGSPKPYHSVRQGEHLRLRDESFSSPRFAICDPDAVRLATLRTVLLAASTP